MASLVVSRALWLTDPERFCRELARAQRELKQLSQFYPNFNEWFELKVVPGLSDGSRQLILKEINNELAAVAVLKRTETERKLCSLRVMPAYQGTGTGLRMFQEAFQLLETERPLLSVAEEQLPRFERVFDFFGFEQASRYDQLYRPRRAEFSFNGLLLPPAAEKRNVDK